MKLEDQVCSLELAKKLKELGVKQDSFWYWYAFDGMKWNLGEYDYLQEMQSVYSEEDYETVTSAFTVAELGEMLPSKIEGWFELKEMKIEGAFNDGFRLWYFERAVDEKTRWFEDGSEANARAKMLVHLIEQGMVTLELLKKG